MSQKKLILYFTLLWIVFSGAALAQDSGNSLGYEVLMSPSGAVKLRVTTNTVAAGMWLGITVYVPNAKNGAKDVQSQVLPLKQGKGIYEIIYDPRFKNGTFEVAVWAKKLSQNECGPGDDQCRKNGYKMTGMVSYVWGYLSNL